MTTLKPMLASPVNWDTCTFPKYVSPKLDGIRCLIKDGVAYSRSLKPIPNKFIQSKVSHLHGHDGELIVGSPTDHMVYRNTNSGVMSVEGEPEFAFYVFDRWDVAGPWSVRFNQVAVDPIVVRVPHIAVHTTEDAIGMVDQYLSEGYEGGMLRHPDSIYKFGRATTKEGFLLKVKEWVTSEMIVEGMTERMHNSNEAKINALGYTERSTAKEGKVGLGTMGTLYGHDMISGRRVEVGTGFSDHERAEFWKTYVAGLIVRYRAMKYSGGYDNPRMAVYEGIRNPIDL
jgi:DNA ligase-1